MISAANRHSLPTMFFRGDAVAAGALASYGHNHLVGVYTGRILKRDKPADLPVRHPTKKKVRQRRFKDRRITQL
jgi:putative ABC transport system substrate-binding protein